MKKITDLQSESADNLLIETALTNFENELNALIEKHSAAIGPKHSVKVKNTILESLKTRKNSNLLFENNSIESEDVGDKNISKMATEMVGDGKDPNKFFIVVSDDYYFDGPEGNDFYSTYPDLAPVKLKKIETKTLGPFDTIEEAMNKIFNIHLDSKNGPRMVNIEDRKNGLIYERFLTAYPSIKWSENQRDDTKNMLK